MRVARIVQFAPDLPCLLGEITLRSSAGAQPTLDISVVMPCLNEEAAVAATVAEAFAGIRSTGLAGEVVVVDNGSIDGSAEAARRAGARVVHETTRGYGNACRRGLAEARGRMVVLGDSDGTYPFSDIPRFVESMANGVDVVMGSRLNEAMERGAMPWLHRHVGNPGLTWLLNLFFPAGISDAHCGLRAIRQGALDQLELSATGMEFASEFLIDAVRHGLTFAEIPITYRRRLGGVPKLRAWRDGWRHLRLILIRGLDRFDDRRRMSGRRRSVTTIRSSGSAHSA
jgi:glycosyltransferase involved in cell wall biosynthesis